MYVKKKIEKKYRHYVLSTLITNYLGIKVRTIYLKKNIQNTVGRPSKKIQKKKSGFFVGIFLDGRSFCINVFCFVEWLRIFKLNDAMLLTYK